MRENASSRVDIQIGPDFASQVDKSGLQIAVAAALRHKDTPVGAAVTLVVTSDEEIRQLTRQFRQVDTPTDVLAFPAATDAPFVEAPGQPRYLGDVIISYPLAVAQATEAGQKRSGYLFLSSSGFSIRIK